MNNPESKARGALAWAGVAGVFLVGFIFGKATENLTEAPPVSVVIAPSCVASENVLTIDPNETIERITKYALYSR